ncbi:MAG: DUF6512 family protein [Promethearchaeota archaeon]
MKPYSTAYYLSRIFGFLLIFEILHYLYDFFPNIVMQIFSGINESVFQHWKIAFYSYLLLSAIEFGIFYKTLFHKRQFVFTHLFGAILTPWIIFILWYIAPAIYGPIGRVWVEILWAISCTILTIFIITVFENQIKEIEWNRSSQLVIMLLMLILILEFTIFTFHLPWADIFAEPYS